MALYEVETTAHFLIAWVDDEAAARAMARTALEMGRPLPGDGHQGLALPARLGSLRRRLFCRTPLMKRWRFPQLASPSLLR